MRRNAIIVGPIGTTGRGNLAYQDSKSISTHSCRGKRTGHDGLNKWSQNNLHHQPNHLQNPHAPTLQAEKRCAKSNFTRTLLHLPKMDSNRINRNLFTQAWKKKTQYQHHVSWTDWLEHTDLLNLLFPITPWSVQFKPNRKRGKKKHYHHHPTNWLPQYYQKWIPSFQQNSITTILPEMDSNRTALPQYYQKWIPTEQHHHACLLKLQKGFEHQNMLNRLFTIIHSRLGENEENKCY
jgi:hypothetical protein